ncbi:MAG: hypothetical protein JO210_17355 [Acidobacteriaceae bacterium]|nr:hypothetical protein [Acidobacteriaceae bacterium]
MGDRTGRFEGVIAADLGELGVVELGLQPGVFGIFSQVCDSWGEKCFLRNTQGLTGSLLAAGT